MTVWRAFATCVLWIAVALCLFCFAPGPGAQSYPDTGELRGDSAIRGLFEWLALRELATASGADVKAMLWRSMACVMLAVILAAGAWYLFRSRGRARGPAAMLTGAAAKIDPQERRALLTGWPAGGLPETPKAPMAFRLAVIGLLVYLTVNLLSCLWSDAPWLSLAAAADRSIGILWCLCLAGVLRRRWASRGALGVTILSAAAALLGLWFFAAGNAPWGDRLNFPMSNPDFLAAVLLVPLCVCLAGLGHVLRPRQLGRGATWGRRPRLRFWAGVGAAAGTVLLGWAMVLAGSRGAAFGLAVAAGVYLVWRLRRLWKLIPLALLIGAVVVGGLWTVSRFGTPGDPRARSAENRLYLWRHALSTIADSPFLGHGPAAHVRRNQWAAGMDSLRNGGVLDVGPEYHAHNELLEIAEEAGLPMAAVFAAVFLVAAAGGLRSGRAARQTRPLLPAAVAAGVCGMLAHQLVSDAFRAGEVAAISWTWLGLLLALAREQTPAAPGEPADADRPFVRMTVSALALIAGMLAAGYFIARGVWPGYEAKMMSLQMRRTGDMTLWTKPRLEGGKERRFERLLARDMHVPHRLETWQWRADKLIDLAENLAPGDPKREAALTEAGRILTDLQRTVPDFDRVQLHLSHQRRLIGDEAGARSALERHRGKWPAGPGSQPPG